MKNADADLRFCILIPLLLLPFLRVFLQLEPVLLLEPVCCCLRWPLSYTHCWTPFSGLHIHICTRIFPIVYCNLKLLPMVGSQFVLCRSSIGLSKRDQDLRKHCPLLRCVWAEVVAPSSNASLVHRQRGWHLLCPLPLVMCHASGA